jgi:hypothetical protein
MSDIGSQFNRANKLLGELESSAEYDLAKREVSENTKNITQEILVKVKGSFDQALYHFFKKEILPKLSADEVKKAKVYFPMVMSITDVQSTLGRGMMADLDKSHPKIFDYLVTVQPFNAGFEWIRDLSNYANEHHIQLTPQKQKAENTLTISSGNSSFTIGPEASIQLGDSTLSIDGNKIYGNQTIDANSEKISGDTDLQAIRETWVSFLLGNSDIDAINLCRRAVIDGQGIVRNFLSLF